MGDRPVHVLTWAKVNAPVDEGVKMLVEALSAFGGLETVESCEGPPAWVCFRYGRWWDDPWRALAGFALGRIGPHLATRLGDRVSVQASVSDAGVVAEITVREGAMAMTLNALAELKEC